MLTAPVRSACALQRSTEPGGGGCATGPGSEGRTSRDVVRELMATGRGNAAEVVAATGVGTRRAYELLAQVRVEGNGKVHR
jgi:hypothetical protein